MVLYGEVKEGGVLEPPTRGRGAAGQGEGQVYKHYKFARTDAKLKLDRTKNAVKGDKRPEVRAALADRGRGSGNPAPPLPPGPPPQPAFAPGPEPHCPQPVAPGQ